MILVLRVGEHSNPASGMHRITLILLGVLTASSALQIRFSCALAQEMSYTLLTVFTNPTPASGDYFVGPEEHVVLKRV